MRWAVVGAGSAGCVVARRLHDAGHRVALVESGPPLRRGAVPPELDGDDALAALGVPGRTVDGLLAARTASAPPRPYPRGRGVGGSGAVNAMLAARGSGERYRSWGWDDVDGAFERVLVPCSRAADDELGRLDRALLEASDDAVRAPLTRRGGRRVTPAEAYLWPIAGSERLELVTGATVDVVTADASGAATGVRLADGTALHADAVVLAAGAVSTPAILLRSGLGGPRVGTGLADHPAVGLALRLRPGSLEGTGAGGLVTATHAVADGIELLPLNHLGPDQPPDLAMLLVALLDPAPATGVVRVVSDDPEAAPVVELDLLATPGDRARLRAGVAAALDLLRRPPFEVAVAEVLIDDVGTDVGALGDDEAIERWLLAHGADYVHAACSTAGALEGTHGRVRGHEALLVADASAFPAIPDAGTHLPTMMLAERSCAAWVDRGP